MAYGQRLKEMSSLIQSREDQRMAFALNNS